ncbi:recombinase family protein [Pseudomonas citronellolis]|uniref:recombinase family protein n=1 Tax=Pseudomonas citronellolis TaxID=53408 RepID=UPI0036F1A00B
MSTEHQQYSTENQLEAIERYADVHGLQIVRVYSDAGKSGLSLEGRESLQQLFIDVETGVANYSMILVYDVSRWGRFQDPDVSASYEVRCRQSGVAVEYCAEQFTNDGSPVSGIVKSVKRMMAGEYSRELSVKVFAGQARLIKLGFRQGGPAGYGLRRQLLDQRGDVKTTLNRGEHKSFQTDRVVLVPGPESEQMVIREIYRLFVEEGRNEKEIASKLNESGLRTDLEHVWTRGTVHQILINEKYIGNNVWNRTSCKLQEPRIRNPVEQWVRADGAFPAIVDKVLFQAAQAIIQSRSRNLSDEQMLEMLRRLFERRGYLSGLLIDEEEDCPSSSTFRCRFGSLLRSYALIGYTPERDYSYLEANRRLREQYPRVLQNTFDRIQATGAEIELEPDSQLLFINKEFKASIVLCRCQAKESGYRRWKVRFDFGLFPDLTIAVRMQPGEHSALDYYVFPMTDLAAPELRLGEINSRELDIYRFDSLEILATLSRRAPIWRAA